MVFERNTSSKSIGDGIIKKVFVPLLGLMTIMFTIVFVVILKFIDQDSYRIAHSRKAEILMLSVFVLLIGFATIVLLISVLRRIKHTLNKQASKIKDRRIALNESRKRLKTLFRVLPVGVVLVEKQTHIIVDTNNKALELIGVDRNQLLGSKCNGALCQTDHGICSVCQNSVSSDHSERMFKNSSGVMIPILKTVNTIMLNGKEHILETFVDITEQKDAHEKLEQANHALEIRSKALEQSQKAAIKLMQQAEDAKKETESANSKLKESIESAHVIAEEALHATNAKSQFLANMSHEIRTPMNSIIGFSDILTEENLSEQQHKYVEAVRNSASHLLQLINDILDFSKIEAGKLHTEIIDFPLSQFIMEVDSMIRPMAVNKKLKFEILQCSSLPMIIKSDPSRIKQCLINLITNAIKFTSHGHVYLNVYTEKSDSSDFIRFDIEDTGIGIPEDKIGMIFDPFSQADGSTTRKYGGTGLGLSITKQLTEILNGRISVKSTLGKGSTFSISIPAGINIDSQPQMDKYEYANSINIKDNQRSLSLTHHSGKVLVAEDNPSNQMLISLLLKKIGMTVILAQDGLIAIEKVQKENFDLILMDIQMPNMNGYEAVKKIRAMGYKVPIIALTANAMDGDRDKCVKAGCDDYLTKPIKQHELFSILNKFMSHSADLPAPDSSKNIQIENMTENKENNEIISELINEKELLPAVEIFTQRLPEIMKKITETIRENDLEQLKLITHDLKGSSSTAGFPQLADSAMKIEEFVKNNQIDNLKQQTDDILALCNKIHNSRTL